MLPIAHRPPAFASALGHPLLITPPSSSPTRTLRCSYAPKVLAGLPYPASNVFVEKSVANGADLLARVQRLRPLLERQRRAAAAAGGGATLGGAAAGSSNSGSGIAARPVRLLVIDSVAHVFRDLGETGGGVGELAGRTELLFRMSTLLRCVAKGVQQ